MEEIQDVLTDLMFINHGRIVLECSMEEFESRYVEVMLHPDHVDGARSLKPMHERQVFGRSVMLFEDVDRGQLAALGEVRRPSIADLFVAVMGNSEVRGQSQRSEKRNEYCIYRRAVRGQRSNCQMSDHSIGRFGARYGRTVRFTSLP